MSEKGNAEDPARELRERQARAERALADTSSLPKNMFETCDPVVEAAIADAALRVFRRHMTSEEQANSATPIAAGEMRTEKVDISELRACASELVLLTTGAPPELDEGLSTERMWILIDMSKHAAGVARQKATRELRDLLSNPDAAAEIGLDVLRQLVPLLADAKNRTDVPVIFHALHLGAERALRAQERR